MALFDTDVLIDCLRKKQDAMELLLKYQDEPNCCSVITSGEILFGMRENEKRETLILLDALDELPVDKEIIRLSREIKEQAAGFKLELYDCIISATALKYGQLLVTGNARHYPDKRLKIAEYKPD